MTKEKQRRKETPPLSPHSFMRKGKSKEKKLLPSNSKPLEFDGFKNKGRMFLFISLRV
jgi:hypothetical protein